MIMKNPYVIDSEHVCIQGNKLKEVGSFCYLGSTISNGGDCHQDIKRRKALARVTFKNLNKLWQDRHINIKTKLRIFTTNVLAILFYGTETCKTNKSIDKQINIFQIQCLRKILRIKWYERITNEEVLKQSNSKSANLLIKKKEMDLFRPCNKEKRKYDCKSNILSTAQRKHARQKKIRETERYMYI